MRLHLAVLALVAACGGGRSAATVEPAENHGGGAPAAATDRRCLPVVAAECGCVYGCGAGTRQADGRWRVEQATWTAPLDATVAPWCVDGQCTDAFHGEIVCDSICPPRPADPTCHFDGGACVGAR